MKAIGIGLALGAMCVTSVAAAGDAENGRRIAQANCSMCHTVGLSGHDELANSPPFAVIANKYDEDMLLFAILDPHPRMNLRISRLQAVDVAAYIHTLAR